MAAPPRSIGAAPCVAPAAQRLAHLDRIVKVGELGVSALNPEPNSGS